MIKVLSISGSPTVNSSTELLLRRVAGSIAETLRGDKVRHTLVRLNDLEFTPCQACGESPVPRFCFFDDDLTSLYRHLIDCDCLLFGSPIFFDAVSAQAKAFIDRCNCIRPADFDSTDPDHRFVKRVDRTRPGAIVLVGSERGWFEGARRCIAGLFQWTGVVNEGLLKFHSTDFTRVGEVVRHADVLAQADKLGRQLAGAIERLHAEK